MERRLYDRLDAFCIRAVANERTVDDVPERSVLQERVVVAHDVEVSTGRFVPALDSLAEWNVQTAHTTTITYGVTVVEADTLPHDVHDGVVRGFDVKLHTRVPLIPLHHRHVEREFERVTKFGRRANLWCNAGVVPGLAVDRVVVRRVGQQEVDV